MGFDIGISRPRFSIGGFGLGGSGGSGGLGDLLGLGAQARPGVPEALGLLNQLQQLTGGGAAGTDATAMGANGAPMNAEQLLRKLQELAQTNPEALMQALRQNPQLAELLQMLLGGASLQQAAGAQGASAPRGGGGGGGGGGGSKGGIHKDGPGGFLWKPQSDSDGRLAILTPEKMTGQVAGVSVKDPSGRVIETGRSAGVANGDREHFRFSRPGGAFPPGSIVEIKLKNGETVNYTIPNPSQRYD